MLLHMSITQHTSAGLSNHEVLAVSVRHRVASSVRGPETSNRLSRNRLKDRTCDPTSKHQREHDEEHSRHVCR